MHFPNSALCSLVYSMFLLTGSLQADEAEPVESGREKAEHIFEHEMGEWRSRWETPRRDGTTAVREGTEIFTRALDGKAVQLVTRVDGEEHWSEAIRFYNEREKQIVFISVSTSGDYYVMRQDVDSEIVEYGPFTARNGRETMFRFRTTRKTENEMDIVMEYSFDLGKSWEPRRYQYMHRVKS